MNKYTYISLFSGGGVGCYGFKKFNFECIATNEILKERLNIQKYNKKCRYKTGYILGDLREKKTKEKIHREINKWKETNKNLDIDVILATPPCQGMSSINLKKNSETHRNSLVLESIELIGRIEPKIFIFENVRSFLKTICEDKFGNKKTIKEKINEELEKKYNIANKIINFKDYGVPSSRTRTLVIGTRKNLFNLSPHCLFPLKSKTKKLKDLIFSMKSLEKMSEIDSRDIYHFFRSYPIYMRSWIKNLKPGETALNNLSDNFPYKLVNGKKLPLKSIHLKSKYQRMYWDKPAPCIHTRNDIICSNQTIHPSDDRVLSIRELMKVMTIPDEFKWSEISTKELNKMSLEKKQLFLKKNELNIRRIIGEAVPTNIFYQIAEKIKKILDYQHFVKGDIKKFDKNNFFINSYVFEKKMLLEEKKKNGSFFTSQSVVFESLSSIEINKKNKIIKILEPSIGTGNFIPQLISIFDFAEKVIFTVCDINKKAIVFLKQNLKNLNFSKKQYEFIFFHEDFLTKKIKEKFDYIVGNPPFFLIDKEQRKKYLAEKLPAKGITNIFSLFIYKSLNFFENLIFLFPKNFLTADLYAETRNILEKTLFIKKIVDYGHNMFQKVTIEIISIHFTKRKNSKTLLKSYDCEYNELKPNSYVYHDRIWMIYRDEWFDFYIKKLALDSFSHFRDRQITNKYLDKNKNKIWIIRSKNIFCKKIKNIPGYDRYTSSIDKFISKEYLNKNLIIMPNFTYNIRFAYLPKKSLPNGSVVILKPKNGLIINDKILDFFSTSDFTKYFSLLKNKSKNTINIDKSTTYYLAPSKKILKNHKQKILN